MSMTLTDDGWTALLTDGYAQFNYMALLDADNNELSGRGEVTVRTVLGKALTLEAYFTNAQAVGSVAAVKIYTASSGGTELASGSFDSVQVKASSKAAIVTVQVVGSNG